MEKLNEKSAQRIEGTSQTSDYSPRTEKPIRKIRDARRLLSRLICDFRNGKMSGADAKTLTYMLISYVTICKDTELEERITELERFATNRTQH